MTRSAVKFPIACSTVKEKIVLLTELRLVTIAILKQINALAAKISGADNSLKAIYKKPRKILRGFLYFLYIDLKFVQSIQYLVCFEKCCKCFSFFQET